jgi:hypothetical protein
VGARRRKFRMEVQVRTYAEDEHPFSPLWNSVIGGVQHGMLDLISCIREILLDHLKDFTFSKTKDSLYIFCEKELGLSA